MKRRKGVTVFSALAVSFVILAIASYAVILLALLPMFKDVEQIKPFIAAFDIAARNQDILRAFTVFDTNDLTLNVLVLGSLAIFLIVGTIWTIVDLKRGRKIVFFFLIVFLLSVYTDIIYNLTVLPLKEDILKYYEEVPYVLAPLGGALLSVLASLLAIILFIVDMATGGVEKEKAPAFIQEPTPEVQEGVFEEVKDEEEAKQAAPEVAPAPVEEAPASEEEAPQEEKEEEEAPKKKTAPKKVNKPQPKAAKKEEKPAKKAASSKKPAAKKEDARKTQTITLTNEEGMVYAKAYHVSRRPELNKWQVKATGSDKALKLFNTQKEAIEYADQLAKNQNASIRVHSKEGKIRKHNG